MTHLDIALFAATIFALGFASGRISTKRLPDALPYNPVQSWRRR